MGFINGKELLKRVAECGCCVQVFAGTEIRCAYILTQADCNEFISSNGLNELSNDKGMTLIIKDSDEFEVVGKDEYSLNLSIVSIRVSTNPDEWC